MNTAMKPRLQALLVGIPLLFFTFYLHAYVFSNIDPTNPFSSFLTHSHRHRNLAVNDTIVPHPPPQTQTPPSSVLLPDWEVLRLLPANTPPPTNHDHNLSCIFHNGHSSPARFAGTIPSSARPAFICSIPSAARRLRPLLTPRLSIDDNDDTAPPTTMLRMNRLVFESVCTTKDVILFAKGINNRQGVNRPASDLRCFFQSAATSATAITAVTSSAQEVFRCAHPDSPLDPTTTTISLLVGNDTEPVPSLASYRPPPEAGQEAGKLRSDICACTMVFNVSKFIREWVVYHSSIGVERFVIYDNGSEDKLETVVDKLNADGFKVSARFWPWPKSQEAGFSHCAAVERNSCKWMSFLDVDEFAFSPAWSRSSKPDRSMLSSLLPRGDRTDIGQVSLRCRDFGPSGQRSHPAAGVTQGYTCRRRAEERHKSLVRLDAVADSLVTVIHHFVLADGWRTHWSLGAVVNHYKYQAWSEFKAKFRRRVPAYVADWTEPVNMRSKDRTPGLGTEAVKPKGWEEQFCEVRDTRLRDTVRGWFGPKSKAGQYKLAWEEDS